MPLAALKQLEEHFPDVVPKVRFSLENQEVAEVRGLQQSKIHFAK